MTPQQHAFLAHVGSLVRRLEDDPCATATTRRECRSALASIVRQARSSGLALHAIADAMGLPVSRVSGASLEVRVEVNG